MNYAIIGANYGDEGKGLVTDYLVSRHPNEANCVVRYNGGAQAGHTVVTPEGVRHVFHHFGSGHFLGAATHFSKDFIVNPLLFEREYKQLPEGRKLSVSPSCRITFPHDMALNQEIERFRKGDAHGSCGVGIFETIERSKTLDYQIRSPEHINAKSKLSAYTLRRCCELGIVHLFASILEKSEHIWESWEKSWEFFKEKVEVTDDVSCHDNLFFEGAQGLLLNERYGNMPHCTPSDMTIAGIVNAGIDLGNQLTAYYVSRSYLTRHGNGPMETSPEKPFKDETNVNNELQGCPRVAPLDAKALVERIKKASYHPSIKADYGLVLTHMDKPEFPEYLHGESMHPVESLGSFIRGLVNFDVCFSNGKTRETLHR